LHHGHAAAAAIAIAALLVVEPLEELGLVL
jgi:hypothetical protein